ncbi:MAG: hypothetical protein Q8S26_01885 [Azonexus sp.]|nr:hypothetical protein [Azonexus sp.]
MRMLGQMQLETMVKEFLESERPEMYRRLKQSKELDALATSRAEAARESYLDAMDMSTEEVRAMNQAEKETPGLGQSQYWKMRDSRIVEEILNQMLDFQREAEVDESI